MIEKVFLPGTGRIPALSDTISDLPQRNLQTRLQPYLLKSRSRSTGILRTDDRLLWNGASDQMIGPDTGNASTQGSPEPVHLPTDRPRPARRTPEGARESLLLPQELARSLNELSCKRGVTLFITALAAFQTLVHRYTGTTDLVIGSM